MSKLIANLFTTYYYSTSQSTHLSCEQLVNNWLRVVNAKTSLNCFISLCVFEIKSQAKNFS